MIEYSYGLLHIVGNTNLGIELAPDFTLLINEIAFGKKLLNFY